MGEPISASRRSGELIGACHRMATLHLGVVELPYASPPQDVNAPRAARAPKPTKSGQPRKVRAKKHGPWLPGSKTHTGEETTGDVATWLENKYKPMEAYLATHGQEVADHLAQSMIGAMETQAMGGPVGDSYAEGADKIAQGYRDFLASGEIETLGIPGLPTDAAQRGVNHRFKLKKGHARPSLIDTGLYQSSSTAWVET